MSEVNFDQLGSEEKNCVWQFVSKASFASYDDKGDNSCLDVALWKCKECGEVKIEEY
jgi:hypothetical protein